MKDVAVTKFKHKISFFMDQIHFNHERYYVLHNGERRAVILSAREYEELIEYVNLRDEMRAVK